MKNKELLQLINLLTRWCKLFKENLNLVRWSDHNNEIQIELIPNVDYVIQNKERLVVNTNLRDDFDKFIDDIKDSVDNHYYEIKANEYEKRMVLHVRLPKDYYAVIKAILQLRISDIPMSVYLDQSNILCVESSFENGYDVLFELKFENVFEASLKETETNEFLDYSFAYITADEMFGILYKVEQADKNSLNDLNRKEVMENTGLFLKYEENE